jgi:hypothetical protein
MHTTKGHDATKPMAIARVRMARGKEVISLPAYTTRLVCNADMCVLLMLAFKRYSAAEVVAILYRILAAERGIVNLDDA